MKAASVKELQLELEQKPHPELVALCLRLARFKKENKELLTYLLFESFDQEAWIRLIKKEMEEQFEDMNRSNNYLIKKSLRKILRTISKFSRYSGETNVEIQLLLHFCLLIRSQKININASEGLFNLYQNQLKKLKKLIATMHEDLQYDYLRELSALEEMPAKTSVAKKILSYFENKKNAKVKDKKTSS